MFSESNINAQCWILRKLTCSSFETFGFNSKHLPGPWSPSSGSRQFSTLSSSRYDGSKKKRPKKKQNEKMWEITLILQAASLQLRSADQGKKHATLTLKFTSEMRLRIASVRSCSSFNALRTSVSCWWMPTRRSCISISLFIFMFLPVQIPLESWWSMSWKVEFCSLRAHVSCLHNCRILT